MFIKTRLDPLMDKFYIAIQKGSIPDIYSLSRTLIKSYSNIKTVIRAFLYKTPDYIMVNDKLEEMAEDFAMLIIDNIYDLQKMSLSDLHRWLDSRLLGLLSTRSSTSFELLTSFSNFNAIDYFQKQTETYADPNYFIEISDLLKEVFKLYRKHFTKSDIESIISYHRELSMNITEDLANYYLQFVSFLIIHYDIIKDYLRSIHTEYRYRLFYQWIRNILKGYPPTGNNKRYSEVIRHFRNIMQLITEKENNNTKDKEIKTQKVEEESKE